MKTPISVEKLNLSIQYLWKTRDILEKNPGNLEQEEQEMLVVGYVTKAETLLFEVRSPIDDEE